MIIVSAALGVKVRGTKVAILVHNLGSAAGNPPLTKEGILS